MKVIRLVDGGQKTFYSTTNIFSFDIQNVSLYPQANLKILVSHKRYLS